MLVYKLIKYYFNKTYYDIMFKKEVRIKYIKYLFVIIFGISTYFMGYKSRDNYIIELHNKVDVLYDNTNYTQYQLDSITELQYHILNDRVYYEYIIYKHSGVKIPETVPLSDLKLLDSLQRYYKIPKRYLYRLINKESRYKPDAKSHKGAFGYMQIMPDTYNYLLNKYTNDLSNLNNRHKNLVLGCFYLHNLYNQYNDWKLTFMAYNAGPGNVAKYEGDVPFLETINYINYICII